MVGQPILHTIRGVALFMRWLARPVTPSVRTNPLKECQGAARAVFPAIGVRFPYTFRGKILAQRTRKQQPLDRGGEFEDLLGSTSMAASPHISGRDETLEVTTGTPAAIAWATGRPKPS